MRFTVAVVVALYRSPVQAGGCDELCREARARTNAEIAEFSADMRAQETNRRLRNIEDGIDRLRRETETQRLSDEYWQRPRRR
jgi:replicative DNA helicase